MDRRTHSPTVRLRRLARHLRRAREDTGRGLTEAAKLLGWSGPKLGRLESASTRRITPGDLDKLAELYGIDAGMLAEWHALATQAKERGWWAKYKKSGVFTDDLPDFEAEASAIRTYESQVIPGLLQTPDYAEALLRGGQAHEDDAIAARVDARMQRQQILHRHEPPTFWAIIDEAALRRVVGSPEVMHAQFDHLARMATRSGVTIQVLPNSVGAHAANTGAILLMDYAEPLDPSLAYVETYAASLFLEEPDEVAHILEVFSHASASALTGDVSAEAFRTHLATLGNTADE
ncbi:helix-turn-helix transcriptional regulator [Nocardiopsis sp. JB363]|uniref:helix-turn-helix domain-containing protein n=1 Tax=Nocardiopsis sp. JB363 TaxID=1434837 RepID=UPI000B353FC2|nr:helix-turn-helix transcriptional regulator [Nocardiopsis sp. JB363]